MILLLSLLLLLLLLCLFVCSFVKRNEIATLTQCVEEYVDVLDVLLSLSRLLLLLLFRELLPFIRFVLLFQRPSVVSVSVVTEPRKRAQKKKQKKHVSKEKKKGRKEGSRQERYIKWKPPNSTHHTYQLVIDTQPIRLSVQSSETINGTRWPVTRK